MAQNLKIKLQSMNHVINLRDTFLSHPKLVHAVLQDIILDSLGP